MHHTFYFYRFRTVKSYSVQPWMDFYLFGVLDNYSNFFDLDIWRSYDDKKIVFYPEI